MGKSTSPKQFCVDVHSCGYSTNGTCIEVIARFPDGKVLKYLLDIGIDYGKKIKGVDAILISHAHEDHIKGLKEGLEHFEGRLYCSEPTFKMATISMSDKGYNSSKKNRYFMGIKEISSRTVQTLPGCTRKINKYSKETFLKNAHILGASMIFLQFEYPGYEEINLLYTGDFKEKTLLFKSSNIPEWILEKSVHVIMESTRGKKNKTENDNFKKIVTDALPEGKNIFILAKSRNQTQEVLKALETLQYEGGLSTEVPIIIIGKEAKYYTELYSSWIRTNFKPEKLIFIENPQKLKEVMYQHQSSIVIGNLYNPNKPIKGMFGKIASDSQNVLVFLSGTLFKQYEEKKDDRLMADYFQTGSFWNHADNKEVIRFIEKFKNLRSILLMHGTTESLNGRLEFIRNKFSGDLIILGKQTVRLGSYQVLKQIWK